MVIFRYLCIYLCLVYGQYVYVRGKYMLVIVRICYCAIALVLSNESFVYVVDYFLFSVCMVGFMKNACGKVMYCINCV